MFVKLALLRLWWKHVVAEIQVATKFSIHVVRSLRKQIWPSLNKQGNELGTRLVVATLVVVSHLVNDVFAAERS